MFSTTDTIVAIATPPGRGGIGVVRLSGPDAPMVAGKLTTHRGPLDPRHATFTTVSLRSTPWTPTVSTCTERAADIADHVVATYFPGPASYTGEDVVELSAHGSPVVLHAIVAAAVDAGARIAEPGEFTLRAYLNGRIDLTQAEAVVDLVDAVTPLQARAAFDQLQGTLTAQIASIDEKLFDLIARLEASVDFPEEGYHFVEHGAAAKAIEAMLSQTERLLARADEGQLVREGLLIALVGAPNVGKSSLFNALVGASRAIVTDIPGTTRDLVTETIDLGGLRATLVDTAGVRAPGDVVESEGVARTWGAIGVSDLTVVVADRSRHDGQRQAQEISQHIENKHLIVLNKSDIEAAWTRPDAVLVSAKTGDGLAELTAAMLRALDIEPMRDRPAITNARHAGLVRRAHEALGRAHAAIATELPLSEEFVLADLQDARAALEEVTGKRAPEDLLEHIFSRFCIGK